MCLKTLIMFTREKYIEWMVHLSLKQTIFDDARFPQISKSLLGRRREQMVVFSLSYS